MIDPLPADRGSLLPEKGLPEMVNFESASETVTGLTHTGVLKLTDRSWNSPESTHKHKERRWHQA